MIVGKKGDDGLHDIESYMALDIAIEDSNFSVSIERDITYIKYGENDLIFALSIEVYL